MNDNQKIQRQLQKFSKELPHFPDERIDYYEAKKCCIYKKTLIIEGQISKKTNYFSLNELFYFKY